MFKSKLFCCFVIGTLLMGFTTLAFSGPTDPVTFNDANLEAKIRTAIGIPTDPILEGDLVGVGFTELDASGSEGSEITDLTGLDYCTDLTTLYLHSNLIEDITPLTSLINLTFLSMHSNQISNIIPLTGLTLLDKLDLDNNLIEDISPLATLTNLTWLFLADNDIEVISALSTLTLLTDLYLDNNQIVNINPLGDLINLTKLYLENNQIVLPHALQFLPNLTWLYLSGNQIINLSPLSVLSNLTRFYLDNNRIVDISALAGMTMLNQLYLDNNEIIDISPLVTNAGIASGDTVTLEFNSLNCDSILNQIPTLLARGASVSWDDADADGDGIEDDCDTCPNDPDDDIDGDGICGDEDACPNDPDNDIDGDGICGDEDTCPNDPDDDIDGDGICGDVDTCPNDADNDIDGDGICGDVDPWPNDPDNDIDGDGISGEVDNCPSVANPGQEDSDGDGIGDACTNDATCVASKIRAAGLLSYYYASALVIEMQNEIRAQSYDISSYVARVEGQFQSRWDLAEARASYCATDSVTAIQASVEDGLEGIALGISGGLDLTDRSANYIGTYMLRAAGTLSYRLLVAEAGNPVRLQSSRDSAYALFERQWDYAMVLVDRREGVTYTGPGMTAVKADVDALVTDVLSGM